jgi:DNA-3-methyladenine glycosylase II
MIRFALQPVAPFRLDLTVWTLRRDPENQVDRWDGREYRRVLMIADTPVETAVVQIAPPDEPQLSVTVSPAAGVRNLKARVMAALNRMLGLSLDMSPFYAFSARQRRLNALAMRFRGVKPPRFPTVWEALVNAISCQQLSLRVGIILMNRLARRFGPTALGDLHALPRPVDLARARVCDLRRMGYSTRKASMILYHARAAAAGRFDLEELDSLDDESACDRLEKLDGIGRWSATSSCF